MSPGEPADRRMGIVDLLLPVAPEAPAAQGDSYCRARLLEALAEVAERVKDGEFSDRRPDGYLLDVVVRDIRCVFVEATPHVSVELSPREQQIALMVAWGRTNQAIASSLEISAWTVSTHIRRIFAKLAVSSRAEMVAHLLAQADFATQARQAPMELPRT